MEDILVEIEELINKLNDEQKISVGLLILYKIADEKNNYFALKDEDGNLVGIFASDEYAKKVYDFISNNNNEKFFNPFEVIL